MMQTNAPAASCPPVPEGHFAVNVPLPGIVLPELIIRREAEAAVADIGGLVLSTAQRDDGSFVVKVSVAKKFAISLYSREHAGEKVPEAKAVGAAMVRHAAELIITRLRSSIDSARAAAEINRPEEGTPQAQLIAAAAIDVLADLDNGAEVMQQQRAIAEAERRKAVCAGKEFERLEFPLHSAAAAGRDDAVTDLLLARGGCAQYVANAVDREGLTALHHAAAAGKATCIAALLDHGAAHQVQTALNPTAVTPMLLAASFGHDDCVRLLSLHNPAAVHACDANGVSPLMMAAAHASVPAVEALLQAGARQSAVDAFGRSALHRAAAAGGGRNRFDASRLIERESGPLEHAPVKPTGAVIALLTRDDGALVDALDHAGYAALHVAAAAADADAVAALCAAGARYDLQAVNDDESGETESSQQKSSLGASSVLVSTASQRGVSGLELKKLRMTLPAQVHRRGATPLHIAAAIGSPELMQAMLHSTQERILEFECGTRVSRHKPPPPPSINVKDARGRCALHVAAAAGAEACVTMLIRSSALIDAQDVDKVTPLAMASAHGQKNVVTALIKAGADLMIRDSQGRTALHRCALAGHAVVASVLVECISLHWRAGVDCVNVVKDCKPQFCSAEQRAEMEQQGAWPWLWAPAFVDNSGRLPLDYVAAIQEKWRAAETRAAILGSHLRARGRK